MNIINERNIKIWSTIGSRATLGIAALELAKNIVVMIEPFKDYNLTGIPKYWTESQDYFAGKIEDLPKYGLKPVFVADNFPNKITLKIAVVVCIKI